MGELTEFLNTVRNETGEEIKQIEERINLIKKYIEEIAQDEKELDIQIYKIEERNFANTPFSYPKLIVDIDNVEFEITPFYKKPDYEIYLTSEFSQFSHEIIQSGEKFDLEINKDSVLKILKKAIKNSYTLKSEVQLWKKKK